MQAVGASGAAYDFYVYPLGTEFRPLPGLYILCSQAANGAWDAHYVGETEDLQSRVGAGLRGHHKVPAALARGATHVAVAVHRGGSFARRQVERDLCAKLSPPCNDKLG